VPLRIVVPVAMKYGRTLKAAIMANDKSLPWIRYKLYKKQISAPAGGQLILQSLKADMKEVTETFFALASGILQHQHPIKMFERRFFGAKSCMCFGSHLAQEELLELESKSRHVLEWAQLNAVAVRKTLKKLLKKQPSMHEEIRSFECKKFTRCAFARSPILMELNILRGIIQALGKDEDVQPLLTTESSDNLTCPICMDKFYKPVALRCGHLFCKGCFEDAQRQNDTCPLCRDPHHDRTRDMPFLDQCARTADPTAWKQRHDIPRSQKAFDKASKFVADLREAFEALRHM